MRKSRPLRWIEEAEARRVRIDALSERSSLHLPPMARNMFELAAYIGWRLIEGGERKLFSRPGSGELSGEHNVQPLRSPALGKELLKVPVALRHGDAGPQLESSGDVQANLCDGANLAVRYRSGE